jgi:hypothetical protein
MMGQLNQHLGRLVQFCLKYCGLARDAHVAGSRLNRLLRKIEPVSKRQTGPTPFDALQQTNANHILRPRVFGLIGLGGMVEDARTAENLLSRLGIDEIIQGEQQTAMRRWTRDPVPQAAPQFLPW